jgi:hypothetical protein
MSALLLKEDLAQYIKITDFENKPLIESGQNVIKTKALIKLNLFDDFLLQVHHISKSYELWKALENLYSFKGFSSEIPYAKNYSILL